MPTDWNQIQRIFEAATACPPDDRPAVLRDACAHDAELRDAVERLLASHDAATDDFLTPPPPPPTAGLPDAMPTANTSQSPDPLIGHHIGQYRIEQVIAAGGMGTVYLARQQNPSRPVAIKLLSGHVVTEGSLRRFEYEAEYLARLRHPNIAQVYEAGVTQVYEARAQGTARSAEPPSPAANATQPPPSVAQPPPAVHRTGPRPRASDSSGTGPHPRASDSSGTGPRPRASDSSGTGPRPRAADSSGSGPRPRAAANAQRTASASERSAPAAQITKSAGAEATGAEGSSAKGAMPTALGGHASHPPCATQDRQHGALPWSRPYFAMEYIPNARPITEYANENALSKRARLDLFIQLCDAVQYGHQRGIIHRDLKPANILVSSGDGDTAQPPPAENVAQPPPAENVAQPLPAENVAQPPPAVEGDAPRPAGADVASAPRGGRTGPRHRAADQANDTAPKNVEHDNAITRDRSNQITTSPNHPITKSPWLKIIDFGVARATDADALTLHTETGQLVGTLQYMSPEQCTDPHDVDVRSDVYSLGMVLYELLCNRLPYDVSRASLATAARIICETEPPRPSTVTKRSAGPPSPATKKRAARASKRSVTGRERGTGNRERAPAISPSSPHSLVRDSHLAPTPFPVRGDLEPIILTALAKDRRQRYQSVADLLRDIRHYLAGEPIEAKKPTMWTRVVTWVVRHPAWATTAICVTIAVATLALTMRIKQRYVDWYLHERPNAVKFDADHRQAYLTSLSGDVLYRWPSCPGGGAFALLTERPARLGGGRIALIAGLDPDNPGPPSLNAYNVDAAPGVAIWSRHVKTDEILPTLRKRRGATGDQFHVLHARALDAFPDDEYPSHPGKEIVAIFAFGDHSARVIRIYDFGGNLLYEVWHDGAVGSVCKLSDHGPLIFGGDCHLPYWNYETDPPTPRGSKTRDFVVFALRPRPGQIVNDDWLPLSAHAGPNGPAWCRRLQPDNLLERVDSVQVKAAGDQPAGVDQLAVTIQFYSRVGGRPLGCSLLLDADGNLIPGSQGAVDAYNAQRTQVPEGDPRRLPDPRDFRFEPMPAIGTHACASSRATP